MRWWRRRLASLWKKPRKNVESDTRFCVICLWQDGVVHPNRHTASVPISDLTHEQLGRAMFRELRDLKEELMSTLSDVQKSFDDFTTQIAQEIAKVQHSLDGTIASLRSENADLAADLQKASDELTSISDLATAKSAELQSDDPAPVEEPDPTDPAPTDPAPVPVEEPAPSEPVEEDLPPVDPNA